MCVCARMPVCASERERVCERVQDSETKKARDCVWDRLCVREYKTKHIRVCVREKVSACVFVSVRA